MEPCYCCLGGAMASQNLIVPYSTRSKLFGRLALIILASIFCAPASDADSETNPTKLRRARFPLTDICDAPVWGIAEDRNGKIYLSSWGEGLFWYDGVKKGNNTRADGLPSLYLRDCLIDQNENLWITSNNGLVLKSTEVLNIVSLPSGIPSNDFFGMDSDSHGNVYVGGENGILFCPPHRPTTFHSMESAHSTFILCLLVDEDRGVLWTGGENGVLTAFDLSTLRPHQTIASRDLARYGPIHDLLFDHQGRMWVASEENTLVENATGWIQLRDDLADTVWSCRSLTLNGEKEVQVGLATGLRVYDPKSLTAIDHNVQFTHDRTHKVFVSQSGTIWLGTQSGATCLPCPFFQQEEIPIPTSRLMDVDLDSRNRLWVGGYGLCYRAEGEWHRVDVGPVPENSYLTEIHCSPSGRVLVSWNFAGVYVWENGEGCWLPDPPDKNQRFNTVIETSDGMIWVGTDTDGIIGWDGDEWIRLPFQQVQPQIETPLEHHSVHSFLESKDGALWIGSVGERHSLFRFEDGQLELFEVPQESQAAEMEDLIECPDGSIFIATNGLGILEFNREEWVLHNRETQPFLTNRFTSLAYDEPTGLWAGTRSDGLYHFANGIWTHFAGDDGLFQCRVDGLTRDERGDLYLATHLEGLLRMVPDKDPPDTSVTLITQKVIRGENLILPVSATDPWMKTPPERLNYLWSLDGGPWRSSRGEQTISVLIEETGPHEILVASVDSSGNVDPTPAVVQVQGTYHWASHPVTLIGYFLLIVNVVWILLFLTVRNRYLRKNHQRDLEHQRSLEEEVLRQTQELRESNRDKEKLIANVSHDFRTPLTNLIGYTQLLGTSASGSLSESQIGFLDVIQNNAKRMKHLIENIAQFAHDEEPFAKFTMESVDLRELAFAALRSHALVANDQNIELEMVCEDVNYEVVGSETLLERLLDNLLSNAIKFSDTGGKVTIRLNRDDDRTTLSVEDQGIGIDPDDLSMIFDRFSQFHRGRKDHTGGLGIGLSICKEIADFHHAKIEVDSTLDKGSNFTLTWQHKKQENAPATVSVGVE